MAFTTTANCAGTVAPSGGLTNCAPGTPKATPDTKPFRAAIAVLRGLLHTPAMDQQQQRIRPMPDAGIGVGACQVAQLRSASAQIKHGGVLLEVRRIP